MHFPYLCRKCRASNSIAWVIFCCASFTSRHPFRYMSVGGQRASMPTFAVADISRKAYGVPCKPLWELSTSKHDCVRSWHKLAHTCTTSTATTCWSHSPRGGRWRPTNRKSDSAWLSKCRCVLRASCRQRWCLTCVYLRIMTNVFRHVMNKSEECRL